MPFLLSFYSFIQKLNVSNLNRKALIRNAVFRLLLLTYFFSTSFEKTFLSLSFTSATFRALLSPEFKSIRIYNFSSTNNNLSKPKFRRLETELDGSTRCVSLFVTKSFEETCTFDLLFGPV